MDSTGSEEELDKILGGTTRTLYHNVFAFGLEELEQFHKAFAPLREAAKRPNLEANQ